jgi:hypothetical protein
MSATDRTPRGEGLVRGAGAGPTVIRIDGGGARRTLAPSRLRRLAQGEATQRTAEAERCEMCGEPMPSEHRHLLDLESRELRCACRACSVLFDHRAAGGGHYRLVPDRSLRLERFALDDATWAALSVPVEMAFFFRSSRDGRVMAFYPSPMGPTESLLGLEAWDELEEANPVLLEMEPDVEALLVNRARGARQYFIVPIDECYRLVALIRTRWRGFTGGRQVWDEIAGFFAELERRSRPREATTTIEGG